MHPSAGPFSSPRAVCALVVAALFATGCGVPEERAAPRHTMRQPDILLYVVDTLRADSIEPYGNEIIDTPALVELAAEGVVFDTVYAHSSWTRPSITSILTGLPPDVHRVETREDEAHPNLRFLAESFAEAGYRTAAIVTNPNVGSHFGFDQGYDRFLELFGHQGGGVVKSKSLRAKAEEVTDAAIEWIDSGEAPYFLFVLTTDPHSPYAPPPAFLKYRDAMPPVDEDERPSSPRVRRFLENRRAAKAFYYGEISYNDLHFGRLLAHLRTRGSYPDTLVVFTSDHGEAFGEHLTSGHGKSLFNEVVHVPLIIRRPGGLDGGTRVQDPVQLLDIYPTLLDAAGLRIPPGLEGHALFDRDRDASRTVFGRLTLDGRSGEMLLRPPWKLITTRPGTEGEKPMKQGLYHLGYDPSEALDLSAEEAERAAELRALLQERLKQSSELASALHGDAGSDPGAGPSTRDMPDHVRDALIALGYLDAEGNPGDGGGSEDEDPGLAAPTVDDAPAAR